MQFAEYLRESANAKAENGSWRMGQTYFNVLANVRPELSEQVRGSRLDPFYRDNYIGKFLAWLAENWS